MPDVGNRETLMPRAERSQLGGPDETVSIIIPAFNEQRWIARTVDGVLAQTLSAHRLEVFVVDTGSTDNTRRIVRSLPVNFLEVSERSSYVARNRGIEASIGSTLVFLDADCIPQPGWLQALLDYAYQESHTYVAGRIENAIAVNNLGNRLLAYRTNAETRRRSAQVGGVAGGNMLVRREVFDCLGPFLPVRSGADILQSRRALKAGFTIGYAEEAVVIHQCDLSNWEYLARRFRIRRGQAMQESSARSLWRGVKALPWRPGWGESQRVADAVGSNRPAAFIFLWFERWAEYLGALAGHCSAVAHQTESGSPSRELKP